MQVETETMAPKQMANVRTIWLAAASVLAALAASPTPATESYFEKTLQAVEAYVYVRWDPRGFLVPMTWINQRSSSSSPCVFHGIQPTFEHRHGRLNAAKCKLVNAARAASDAFRDLTGASITPAACRDLTKLAEETFESVSRTVLYADVANERFRHVLEYKETIGIGRTREAWFDASVDAMWSARAAAREADTIASWESKDNPTAREFGFWSSVYIEPLQIAQKMFQSDSPFSGKYTTSVIGHATLNSSATAARALKYLLDKVNHVAERALTCGK